VRDEVEELRCELTYRAEQQQVIETQLALARLELKKKQKRVKTLQGEKCSLINKKIADDKWWEGEVALWWRIEATKETWRENNRVRNREFLDQLRSAEAEIERLKLQVKAQAPAEATSMNQPR
jgi:hypothetical protein